MYIFRYVCCIWVCAYLCLFYVLYVCVCMHVFYAYSRSRKLAKLLGQTIGTIFTVSFTKGLVND